MTDPFSVWTFLAMLGLFISLLCLEIRRIPTKLTLAIALSMAFLVVLTLTDFIGVFTVAIGALAFIVILLLAGLFVFRGVLYLKRRIERRRYSMPRERVGSLAWSDSPIGIRNLVSAAEQLLSQKEDTSDEIVFELDLTEDG